MQVVKTLFDQPIRTEDGNPPTTVRVLVPFKTQYVGGSAMASEKALTYVLWDVLPEELKQRVATAIQALSAAG